MQRSATPAPQRPETETPGSWRHSLSRDAYRSLSKCYGPMEMERQELIYDLYNSEKTFVHSARHVIRTFFLPLRARDSRTWLPGLPADVARLFDWLEDIVNLHVAIVRALAGVVAVWKTGAIVSKIGGSLRAFVPQLEIYMPYLVKLESVREILRWHAEKDRGELGEYLRMRERERVDGEWALDKLLEEPVVRLHKHLECYQVRPHPPFVVQLLTRIVDSGSVSLRRRSIPTILRRCHCSTPPAWLCA
ncbi:Dbl homology domain-containing protein [Cerioporus squamosus]|nr:Dbl homology domain-containing protein [Cerioporus squamosus]